MQFSKLEPRTAFFIKFIFLFDIKQNNISIKILLLISFYNNSLISNFKLYKIFL